jgi:hypothetical protein
MASSDPSSDLLARNRVILMHFDTYSAALSFVCWDDSDDDSDDSTVLWPDALPDWSQTPAPADAASAAYDGEAVRQALIDRYSFKPAELVRIGNFDSWAQTESGPVRIHLLRFTTFQAPKALLEACDGSFKHLPELRGADKQELLLLREVFGLFIGGGKS